MAALVRPIRVVDCPGLAGWSLWPPLEGEGTGVDRRPLRRFPLLVDSERNIVETRASSSSTCSSRIQGQCVCWRAASSLPGLRIHPSETPHPQRHERPGMSITPRHPVSFANSCHVRKEGIEEAVVPPRIG
jgi:hypothetical protein